MTVGALQTRVQAELERAVRDRFLTALYSANPARLRRILLYHWYGISVFLQRFRDQMQALKEDPRLRVAPLGPSPTYPEAGW